MGPGAGNDTGGRGPAWPGCGLAEAEPRGRARGDVKGPPCSLFPNRGFRCCIIMAMNTGALPSLKYSPWPHARGAAWAQGSRQGGIVLTQRKMPHTSNAKYGPVIVAAHTASRCCWGACWLSLVRLAEDRRPGHKPRLPQCRDSGLFTIRTGASLPNAVQRRQRGWFQLTAF